MKKIILTGGGTAGHVTPNIAIAGILKEEGFRIDYIGSYNGIEKQLVTDANITYHGISSGKLRRYFSWQNFIDPFKVAKGYFQAKKYMKSIRPSIVFSKGGFVSVPVVMAAHSCKIPIIIHESDITPGLANKIASRYATKICYTFPETEKYLGEKAVYTGSPIRTDIYRGNKLNALEMCNFDSTKPVLLVVGGSLGAQNINDIVRISLPELLEKYQVAHLCGKGKYDKSLDDVKGYAQFEYIGKEMSDFYAMADVIVSRAGSNAIWEIAALKKPNVLIPLPADASRGDQLLNAASFSKQGFSEVLDEGAMTTFSLLMAINRVYDNRQEYIDAMSSYDMGNGVIKIVNLISSTCQEN